MIRKYPDGFHEWVKANIKGTRMKELAKMASEHFGIEVTESQMRAYACNHALRNGLKGNGKGRYMWTDERIQFLKDNAGGTYNKELTKMFNDHFGTSFTETQIGAVRSRYSITSGIDARYKKGQVPHNKGVKGVCGKGCEKTWFKKGHAPVNHKEVGAERLNVDGYVEVKVAEPHKWKLRSRIVWEQANGPIPKSSCVIHLNGDSQDDRLENLKLISRAENARLNQRHMRYGDAKLTETAVNIVRLEGEVRKKSERLRKDN